jgi:hypothetical protein
VLDAEARAWGVGGDTLGVEMVDVKAEAPPVGSSGAGVSARALTESR